MNATMWYNFYKKILYNHLEKDQIENYIFRKLSYYAQYYRLDHPNIIIFRKVIDKEFPKYSDLVDKYIILI
jgi:hypothetical protein